MSFAKKGSAFFNVQKRQVINGFMQILTLSPHEGDLIVTPEHSTLDLFKSFTYHPFKL